MPPVSHLAILNLGIDSFPSFPSSPVTFSYCRRIPFAKQWKAQLDPNPSEVVALTKLHQSYEQHGIGKLCALALYRTFGPHGLIGLKKRGYPSKCFSFVLTFHSTIDTGAWTMLGGASGGLYILLHTFMSFVSIIYKFFQ